MDFWINILMMFCTGIVSGIFGALLGIGGATILIPVLTLLFLVPIHLAVAISLINNVAVSLTSALKYNEQGLVHKGIVFVMNVGSILGIVIGTFIATRSPESAIKFLFGIFLVAMVTIAFIPRKAKSYEKTMDQVHAEQKPGLAGLGFFMGLLGALLGIGGGTVAVPTLNDIFHLPFKNSIANSLATIVLASSLGAIVYFYLGSGTLFSARQALLTAVVIVPGSVIGAQVGTHVSKYIPTKQLKYIFYALLLYMAYNLIRSGLGI